MSRRVHAAAALVAMLAVVVGVPLLLVLVVGNPWPGSSRLAMGDEAAVVVGVLTVLGGWCGLGSSSPSRSRSTTSSPNCVRHWQSRRRSGAVRRRHRRARVPACWLSGSSPRCSCCFRSARGGSTADAEGGAPTGRPVAMAVASVPVAADATSGTAARDRRRRHRQRWRHAVRLVPHPPRRQPARWREIFDAQPRHRAARRWSTHQPEPDPHRVDARAAGGTGGVGRRATPASESTGAAPSVAAEIVWRPATRLWDLARARLAAAGLDARRRRGRRLRARRSSPSNGDVLEDPNVIYVGERLHLPVVDAPPAAPEASAVAPEEVAVVAPPAEPPVEPPVEPPAPAVIAPAPSPPPVPAATTTHVRGASVATARRRSGTAAHPRVAVADRHRRGRVAVGRRGRARGVASSPALAVVAPARPGPRAPPRRRRCRTPAARRRRRRATAARRRRRACRRRFAGARDRREITVVRVGTDGAVELSLTRPARCRPVGGRRGAAGAAGLDTDRAAHRRGAQRSARRASRSPSSASTPTAGRCWSTSRRSACWRSTPRRRSPTPSSTVWRRRSPRRCSPRSLTGRDRDRRATPSSTTVTPTRRATVDERPGARRHGGRRDVVPRRGSRRSPCAPATRAARRGSRPSCSSGRRGRRGRRHRPTSCDRRRGGWRLVVAAGPVRRRTVRRCAPPTLAGSWRRRDSTSCPVGLTAPEVASLHAVLAAADAPLVVDEPAADDGDSEPGPATPPWTLLVRLLGPVDVVDDDGRAAGFERSKALELVAWLTMHRERATRVGARTALWELDVRDATFANVVSEARRAMARLVEPPPDGEWLGPHADRGAAVARRCGRRRRPGAASPGRAPGCSRPSWPSRRCARPSSWSATCRSPGTGYLWPDAEGITSNLVLLATSAATELAGHSPVDG